MFRHFPPKKTLLKLIRLNIQAFFIYTTCLSDPVEKSSKNNPLKENLNPKPPLNIVEIKKSLATVKNIIAECRERSAVL